MAAYIFVCALLQVSCVDGTLSIVSLGSGSSPSCPAVTRIAGYLDSSLSQGTGFNGGSVVNAITLQPDGKVLIGGTFTSYNGTGSTNIVRLNADGSFDSTFITGAGTNAYVTGFIVLPSGKIMATGNFTNYAGTSRVGVMRLNSNGILDATFGTTTGANSVINAIAVQSTGDFILGGAFTAFEGTPQNNLARAFASNGLNDGSMLTLSGTSGTGQIHAIAMLPNDNFIVAGAFTNWESTAKNRIARAFAGNGNNDASFGTATGANNAVFALALQPDGKLLLGGSFTSYEGVGRIGIARANTDGTNDATFNPGTGGTTVRTIALQSDGKILVGGNFATFNGTAMAGLVRLNSNGSLDTSFNPSGVGVSGGAGAVMALAISSASCYTPFLFGGNFTIYDGSGMLSFGKLFQ